MSAPPLPAPARRLIAAVAVSAIGSGMTLPFLLIYLSSARGIALEAVGVLLAVPPAVGLAFVGLSGALVDRWGARRILAAALAAMIASSTCLAVASSTATAAAGLVLAGVGRAAYYPALQSLIAGVVEPSQRQRYFGMQFAYLNVGGGLGGVFAALVASSSDPASFTALFLVDAATYVPLLVLVARRAEAEDVPATPAPAATPSAAGARPAGEPVSAGGYRQALADRRLRVVLLLSFFGVLGGYAQLDSGWTALAVDRGVSASVVGVAFAANTLTIVALQWWFARRLQQLSHAVALALAFGLSIAMWAVVGAALLADAGMPRDGLLVASLCVFALGEMLLIPTAPTIVNHLAPEALRGRYNALYSVSGQLGALLAPILATLLVSHAAPGVVLLVLSTVLALGLGASLVIGGMLRPADVAATPVAQPTDA